MWGPFSGLAATVGGGMSHYAVNYGSGLYGVSAESLLGMDVILASGEMLSTGSGGGTNSLPFFRYYGPDLTGLFVGDAGALGVKARMTLRLMHKPAGFAASSFGFPDRRELPEGAHGGRPAGRGLPELRAGPAPAEDGAHARWRPPARWRRRSPCSCPPRTRWTAPCRSCGWAWPAATS